jgi:hypothetical protein
VPISAVGRISSWFFVLYPLQSFSVKHAKVAVILFAVIAPEDIQLLVIESGSMILDLRCAETFVISPLAPKVIDILSRLTTHHWVHG